MCLSLCLMQVLRSVTCCAGVSQSPQQGPPAWLARWLDVAIAAGAAAARCRAETATPACWPGGCCGRLALTPAGGRSAAGLRCCKNDCEVTTSAEIEHRVVCGLSVLHDAVAERGGGSACAAGWVRASSGAGVAGGARNWGTPVRRWRCWRQRSRQGHGGGLAAAGIPMGKGRPGRCKTRWPPAMPCHHVNAAAWNDLLQPKRLHRV